MADVETRQEIGDPGREGSRLENSVRQHVLTEKALESERDFFAAVLESADAFILVLDRAGRIVQVNRAAKVATGYTDDDLRGREFVSVLPIHEAAATLRDGLRRLDRGANSYSFETHWAASSGERMRVAGSLTPMRDADGALSHVVVTASDITEERALEEELRAMSLRDDMTGLYNRRGFALLTEQRLKESRRSGATLTMFYADVDHLKAINDAFGHNAGDIALLICAQALEATFRESDVVARVGGDEFVVLAEADVRDLNTVMTPLETELNRRTAESGLQFPLSLTIGASRSKPPHTRSLDSLLREADQFMYERKHREPHKFE